MELSKLSRVILNWVYIIGIYLLWAGGLILLKSIVYKKIREFSQRTRFLMDDVLLDSLHIPLILIILGSGLVVVEKFVFLGQKNFLDVYFRLGYKITVIAAFILFLDSFSRNIFKAYSEKFEALKTWSTFFPFFSRLLILGVGLLILLNSFGVSVTSLLAFIGIGSLPIALSLQSTIENFVAGIQIFFDEPIKKGQFIKLETGEEGFVEKIGWRSTWIRQITENTLIVPNKTLFNSRVINYDYPTKKLVVTIEVGCDYNSDLNFVEKVATQVAEEVMRQVSGGVLEFQPFIRFHTFGESGIYFTAFLGCHEFVGSFLIKHEFIKKLHQRYQKEGLKIPFPVRTVELVSKEGREKPRN